MLIIPAIDIKNGKCVRLSQGQMDKETIYELIKTIAFFDNFTEVVPAFLYNVTHFS